MSEKIKKIGLKRHKKVNRSLPTTVALGVLLFVIGAFMALPLLYAVISGYRYSEGSTQVYFIRCGPTFL